MPTIEVELSPDEVLAAGGEASIPLHRTYADAWAEQDADTGLLRIRRGDDVVAEYPLTRFVTWRELEGEPEAPAGP